FSLVFRKLQELRRKQENVVQFHTNSSRFISLLVFAALLVGFSPAMAQETDAAADGNAEAAEEEQSSEEEQLDPEDPQFWAKSREVYTVQKRPFLKEGRFAATLYGGIIPNNIFEQYFPAGLRLNYYILENIGLELAGSYAFKAPTGLKEDVRDQQGVGAEQILIGDTQIFHGNFGVVWSPFYGKTSFYSSALNYFDLYLFGGVGMVVTETQNDFNTPPDTGVKAEGVLGAGLAFYLGENASIRMDYRQFVFPQVNPPGGIAQPSEVSLGFGWFF
ncbi:MAG: outer membrane beta-barrel domain-containing protein, partial [Persicimonas sp.]